MNLTTLRSLVLSLFRSSVSSRRSSVRRCVFERLEPRALLAGNVLVQLQDGNARITGDGAANQFEITGGVNSILVRGLEGTTINGATTEFTLSSSSTFSGQLTIDSGDGNDRVAVGADVTLSDLQILGGAGDDNLSISSGTVRGGVVIDAGQGSNTVTLLNAQLQAQTNITSSGPALISVRGGRIGGRFTVRTDGGDDQFSADATTIVGRLAVELGGGNDVAALRNTTLSSELYIDAGRGDDVVFIDSTNVARRSAIWMREGNDNLKIQGTSRFSRRLLVGAVLGSDHVEVAATATLARYARLGRPAATVEATVIETKVNNSTTGALGRAATAVDQLTPVLSIDITPATVAENAGASAANAVIARTGSTAAALTVNLASSASGRATVPATVTIPAGALTASVNVAAVDNTTAEADATVTLTASAAGYKTGTDQLVVTGQEVAALTLTAPTSDPANTIPEAAAAAARTFTIARNTTDNTQALTVNLTSAVPGRLVVPATVQIAAGAPSATFTVDVQNSADDGDASVQITAAATGLTSATTTVSVIDDDNSATLAVTAAATSVNEAAASGLELTVTRSGASLTQALTVNLTSGNPRLTVPASVTIPENAASVTVTATPVNDTFDDNDAAVQITAAASGFNSGLLSVSVVEDDTAALTLLPATATVAENADLTSRTLTVRRNNVRTTSGLSVTLSTGLQTRLTAPASVEIPAGEESAEFVVTVVDNQLFDATVDVQLTAVADGFSSAQSVITLVDNETRLLTVSPASSSLAENAADGVTLTVSRNTADISQPLTVQLAANSTRISVPAAVTIPVGASSVTFTAAAVQNNVLDGTTSETVTATAATFTAGSATVSVSDDDAPSLTLTPAAATVAENAGTLSAVVSLGRVTTTARSVSLTYATPELLSGPATVTIPAGASSATVSWTIENGPVTDAPLVAQAAASITGLTPVNTQVSITDADSIALTASTDSNIVVASSGTVITKDAVFAVTGTTSPLATVELDVNGDGLADDSTTADLDGDYSLSTTLTHTDANRGANRLVIRATFGPDSADTALNVHYAVGTVIRFATTSGTFDAELLDEDAPITVGNFLTYESSNAWDNLIVHRNVPGFVIQAGGFTVADSVISTVTTNPPISNEFTAANSNVRGTIAMALAGGNINSGTSQWFVNVDDNEFLDEGRYAVFGRVIGSGMQVVDTINGIPSRNVSTLYGNGALAEVPLDNPPPAGIQLTGTVTTVAGSATVTGSGTSFTTQLSPGQSLRIGSRVYFVSAVVSDTVVTLSSSAATASSNVAAFRDAAPPDADFVVFSDISELLGALP